MQKTPKVNFRSDGRYEIRVTIEGKRKSFYGNSKFEAVSKYNKFFSNSEQSGVTGTLENEIHNWLVKYKFGKIKMSSYDSLENIYLYSIKGTWLGKMAVNDVCSEKLQQFIDEKAFNTEHPVSPSTVKKTREVLNSYFKFIYEQNKINRNPMLSVKLPKEENMAKQTKEVEEVPEEILRCILKRRNKRRYNFAFILLFSTGMRSGELIALRWSDVDMDNRTIAINKTASCVKKRDGTVPTSGKYHKDGTTKTTSSTRVIPMNETTYQCLLDIQQDNELREISTEYVMSTNIGTKMCHRNMVRAFDEELYKNGYKHYNLHALRHTFGSRLIRKGVDVKVVSELLGHSKVETTYNIYIHIIQEQKAQAMQLLDIV